MDHPTTGSAPDDQTGPGVPPPGPPFPVVGLGASAGGLEALATFFDHTPPDIGMAFVVILHLAPDYESQAAALLQAYTAMPVTQVTETVPLAPNHVYVIPPAQQLVMVDGHLHLHPSEQDRRAPIDHFFYTLGDTHDSHAAAVILSGTGSDGAIGITRVKERGGAIVVQDPEEAAFTGMPRSAIATGLADVVLPLAAIPAHLRRYFDRAAAVPSSTSTAPVPDGDAAALADIVALLRVRTQHDFTQYKRPTVLRRIGRRMQVVGVSDLAAYADVLRTQPDEVQALLHDLLISVTNFFRDPAAWTALEAIIPQLFADKGPTDQVRVWISACATGEEAYSVAMLLLEHARTLDHPPAIQVFATDIDDAAIRHAREGTYPDTIAGDVAPERLAQFFVREQGRYRVTQELREVVLFAQHNVLRDPPFTRLDLVSCRNLLIYLNRAAQDQVLQVFHFSLRPDGYLLLGSAEGLDGLARHFTTVAKAQQLYRRAGGAAGVPMLPGAGARRVPIRALDAGGTGPRPAVGELHARLLARHAPPSAIVNADYDLVHLTHGASRFLALEGEPSHNLLRAAHPDLRLELQTALFRAAQQGTRVERRGVPVRFDDMVRRVDLLVEPVADGDWPSGYLLVLFGDGGVIADTVGDDVPVPDAALEDLQTELARTREQLQFTMEQAAATAEEYKAANEELQAINEELRAASEEVETSREELQAVNEELSTVNQELKTRIEEVSQANNDLQNLIAATDIATLFLDRQLRITRYTPSAERIFNLIPTDLHRPLGHITHILQDDHLASDAAEVLRTLTPREREVQSTTALWYLMQVRPYRTTDDRIAGVVVTFVDITARTQAEAVLRESEARQAFLPTLSDALRSVSDPVDIEATVTHTAMQYFGADRCYYCAIEDGTATIARDAARDQLPSVVGVYPLSSFPILQAVVDAGRPFVVQDVHTTDLVDETLRRVCIQLQVISFVDVPIIKNGTPVGVLCLVQRTPRDWTPLELALAGETAERTWAAVERARAEAALRTSEARYRTLFTSMDEGYAVVDVLADANGTWNDFRFIEVNPAFVTQTGMDDPVGRTATDVLGTPNPHWAEIYGRVADTGEPIRFEEREVTLGRVFDLYCFRLDGDGSRRVAVLFTDITERKQREANQELLIAIAADLSQLSTEEEIIGSVGTSLAAHLELDCYHYVDVNEDRGDVTIRAFWHALDVPPILGTYPIDGFIPPYGLKSLRAGEPSIINDVENDLPDDRAATAGLKAGAAAQQIGAYVAVPYSQDGRWKAYFAVADSRPRQWTRLEIELTQEVASRMFPRIERARAEAALRSREARFAALLAKGTDMITISDRDGVIVYASPSTARVSGYTADEFMGSNPFADSIHPDDVARCRDAMERLSATPGLSITLQHRARHKDGTWHWYEGTFTSLFHDPAIGGLVANVRDITDRRQAEDARRASEERFRAVANLVPDLLWSNDAAGGTDWYNQRWLDYTGQTLAEATGHGWLGVIHPDDREQSLRTFQTAVDTGMPLRQEHRIRSTDGEYRWFLVQAQPLRDEAGQIVRWYGAATDMHEERMALEAEQAARAEVEAALQIRDQFLSIASHELRTPLTSLLG